jgi:acetyl esterase/lipase
MQLGAAPEAKIGAFGGSSGGHLVLLSAMRPQEPRYATLPIPGAEHIDASLDFVIADAPVTDPYARLLAAQRDGRADLVERHYRYWQDDAAAIDGNPLRILQRGQQVNLPPLFVSQGTDDRSVPLKVTQSFVTLYQQAGGQACLLTFDGLGHGFILQDPQRPESVRQASAARAFIEQIVR